MPTKKQKDSLHGKLTNSSLIVNHRSARKEKREMITIPEEMFRVLKGQLSNLNLWRAQLEQIFQAVNTLLAIINEIERINANPLQPTKTIPERTQP